MYFRPSLPFSIVYSVLRIHFNIVLFKIKIFVFFQFSYFLKKIVNIVFINADNAYAREISDNIKDRFSVVGWISNQQLIGKTCYFRGRFIIICPLYNLIIEAGKLLYSMRNTCYLNSISVTKQST